MMTGLMAARNIMGASYDLWRVNSDAQYLEEDSGIEEGLRLVPRKLKQENQEARPRVAIEGMAGR